MLSKKTFFLPPKKTNKDVKKYFIEEFFVRVTQPHGPEQIARLDHEKHNIHSGHTVTLYPKFFNNFTFSQVTCVICDISEDASLKYPTI